MTSREKFEAWVKFHLDDKFTEVPLYRGNGGLNYLDSQVDLAWIAWQAAETDMAVQLANAESKCRELASENAGLKNAVDIIETKYMNWEGLSDAFSDARGIKTPATDEYLAEVRAQGVEAFVMDFTEPAVMNNGTFYNEDLVEASNEFAAQLRNGAVL